MNNDPLSYQTVQAGAEQRLHDLNIQLPSLPTPFGAYVEVVQTGNLLFLSGRQASLSWATGCRTDCRGWTQSSLPRLLERAFGSAAPFRLSRQGESRGQAWRLYRHGWRFPGTSVRCRCGFGNAGPRFRGRETLDPHRARCCQFAAGDAGRVGSDF
jgi:hypothetical protein